MTFLLYQKLMTVLFVCVIGLAGLLIKRYAWQKKTAALLGGEKTLRYFSRARKRIKIMLLVSGLIFLSIALARPQWSEVKQTISQEGRDVLIALDISRSMLAQDLEPSRIQVAKSKIRDLLSKLTAERVSLLVFSGMAYVPCPFTSDMHAFLSFLDLADVEIESTGTTALDKALNVAIKTFDAVPSRKSRILILFTDGEDFSTDLIDVESKARDQGIHIFTVGVGTSEGAPIPLLDEHGNLQGHQKDAQGNVVITRLNDQLLQQLAQKTGGQYLRITKTDEDVAALIKAVQRFEKEKFDDKTFATKEERYVPFAFLSALLLLVEWMI